MILVLLRWLVIAAVVLALGVFAWLAWPAASFDDLPAGLSSSNPGMAERGAYLVRAASCLPCHWDKKNGGQRFAGGREFKTPFGSLFSPNITPDGETGIGKWSDAEFLRALRHGVGRSGEQLYPALPYMSYGYMTVEDALAIKAYLSTQNAVHRPNRKHALNFPYSWRALLKVWKLMHFEEPHPLVGGRGLYLVKAVGHCAECHSPRDTQGAMIPSAWLQGNPLGPDGWKVPALAGPGVKDFGSWTREQIATYLATGAKPDFDSAQGPMAEVIAEGTKYLTLEDRLAIADYLKSLSTKPAF